jgi:hypothetical protein
MSLDPEQLLLLRVELLCRNQAVVTQRSELADLLGYVRASSPLSGSGATFCEDSSCLATLLTFVESGSGLAMTESAAPLPPDDPVSSEVRAGGETLEESCEGPGRV